MILFFDRNMGTRIPTALKALNLPDTIYYHQELFPHDAPDDTWLEAVGQQGWIVLSQDYKFHRRPNELVALRQFSIGVFCRWGANASAWEVVRVFAAAYERIVAAAATPRPFVFRVTRDARLLRVDLR